MSEVQRAIILAAGMGKRMRPLTDKIPKPLIEVNGKRMIDTIVDGLSENGIKDIYIVVGYMSDKFEEWKEKYPYIHLINNPYYATCNNIASLYVARDYIEDAIILDGDQIIYNSKVLNPYFERSGYNSVWVNENTTEWLQQTEDDIVVECSRTGGRRGWQLYSISRWTKSDGKKLKKHLEQEFEENKDYDIYWDDIALFKHKEEYQLGIYPMNKSDVIEIDNVIELSNVDTSYQKYINGGC